MCHVSYRMCAKIHVLYRVRVHCGSWYHTQCTDLMGVIAEKCVIIVICSVKLRVQALHAFHIEGWECVEAQNGKSLPCDRQMQYLWVNHIREYLSQVYNKYLSCIKTYRSIFQTGGGEREAFTWISRFSTILHSIFIGRKIQGYHSHRNQKYNLHSRSNGCTWGATDSNRPIPISGHFT